MSDLKHAHAEQSSYACVCSNEWASSQAAMKCMTCTCMMSQIPKNGADDYGPPMMCCGRPMSRLDRLGGLMFQEYELMGTAHLSMQEFFILFKEREREISRIHLAS